MLVFVDKTGAPKRNSTRKRGYSLRSKPLISYMILAIQVNMWQQLTCISTAGVFDVMTVICPTSGDTFYHFIQTHSIPHLLPFNGINPNSVVIIDNCSTYHVDHKVKVIQEVGA